MNKIANRAVMCEVLKEAAAKDRDVVVLCSDSRGSASLTSFADTFPEQFVEVGIAEQNLVSIAAGLAACGKKAFAASPASFITTRSYEQCKVDCAYWHLRRRQLRRAGHDPSLRSGYRLHERDSGHAGVSALRPASDPEAV